MMNHRQILIVLCSLLSIYACHISKEISPNFAQTKSFQLVTPKIKIDSSLFCQSAKVSLDLRYPEVEIYYTTDGSEVTKESSLYTTVFEVQKSGFIKAKAFHADCRPSEVSSQQVHKTNHFLEQASLRISPAADKAYAGKGESSLTDFQQGTMNFKEGAAWLGFSTERIEIAIDFQKKESIKMVTLSCLQGHNSWIFLPQQILVRANGKVIGEKQYEIAANMQATASKLLEVPLETTTTNSLIIEIIPLLSIPDWHTGKGQLAWLFLDEVMVN